MRESDISSLKALILNGQIQDTKEILRIDIGRCSCSFYDSSLKKSVFDEYAKMWFVPLYSIPNTIVFGSCLYGPGACPEFKKGFVGNYLFNSSVLGVRG